MKVQVIKKLRFLFEPHRYKVAYGGRAGTKSRAFAAALVLAARSGPERILCCREIQNSIKNSVKRLIENEIKRLGWDDEFYITRDAVVCKATGSDFIFSGLKNNVDSIKSMEGITKCWCEEAHTLSQNSLDVLIPTIRGEDSEIWFSYNPKFETDPVHRMFVVDEPPPGSVVVKVNWTDNPWFPEVLRTKMEWDRDRDNDKYLHVWEGYCVQYSDEQIMSGVWRVGETPEPPSDTIFRYGLDFGFGSDPTAANRFWIDGRTLYIDYEAHAHGVDIDKYTELLSPIPGITNWPIKADSARPDSISYLNKNGFRVVGATKGPGSIVDGISRLRGYDIVINPRCKYTMEEFTQYSYQRDPKTDEILPVIIDDWNHHIDELRYATEGIDADDTYLSSVKISEALERVVAVPFGTPKVLGVFQNVVCRRHGRKVEEMHRCNSTDPHKVAEFVASMIDMYSPDVVIVNEAGYGGSVRDRLSQIGHKTVNTNSTDTPEDERQFYNKVSEMWSRMKDWLDGGDIPDNQSLVADMLLQTYTHDIKMREKMVKSLDVGELFTFGDALATTFAFKTPPVNTYQAEDLIPEWAEDI